MKKGTENSQKEEAPLPRKKANRSEGFC
ncbi:uncharacterized protein METZ01_LOCUS311259, partial [marine metagenome]